MSEPDGSTTSLFTPRKLAAQLVGFVVGMLLLGWCIWIAIRDGDWSRIVGANPWLIAGLIGCTLVSLTVNGASFWAVIRPVQRLRFVDLWWINAVTGLLNYAPIRAGLIARVAYHMRVDGMSILRIGGWLMALSYTSLLTIGACIFTTIIRPTFDLVWIGMVVGELFLGGLLVRTMMGQAVVLKYARGMDRMLRDPLALWGAIGLRLVDIGAFVGRMACAVAILGLSLSVADTLLLGFAAIALTMNPLGRTGFREMAVAFVGSRLISADLGTTQLDAEMAQLALVESAGEALVYIPLGLVSLIWLRRRLSQAPSREPAANETGD